jgi:hypothetical protein
MKMQCWLSSALRRWFPRSEPVSRRSLKLLAARGEQISLQACVRVSETLSAQPVSATATCPGGLPVRLRRVGCVPVPHHNTETRPEELDGVGHLPGYVPDPLFDESETLLAPGEVQSFWLTVTVPAEQEPGDYEITVRLQVGERARDLTATLTVSPVVLQPRQNFPVTHWFYADALCDWYQVAPWSAGFWPLVRKYFANFRAHGSDTLLTPLFTPPLDGVKRPTQLLHVTRQGRRYVFDWRTVERWIATARACGIEQFEWSHFFTQWGVQHALRIYHEQGLDERLLWPPDTGATSDTYRDFLGQLLPELHSFLQRKRLLGKSFFHVSDEPHGEQHRANYIAARSLLRELAPWMQVMDALSEVEYGRGGLTDMPIPSIRVTRQYYDEGIPSWTYFCCGPRGDYLNRLLDTPLAKMRYAGWLFHRFQREGFLHWGYNYWYQSQTRQLIDPFTVTDGLAWPGWAYGDTFLVYPGPQGPLDSLRHEVFAESLQDLALLQTCGVDPEGRELADLQDFNDFPKTEDWLLRRRGKLLS